MSTLDPSHEADPANDIAEALFRLRGRGGRGGGMHGLGMHDSRKHGLRGPDGESGRDPHRRHTHGSESDDSLGGESANEGESEDTAASTQSRHFARFGAGGPRFARGVGGPPAIVRMLEALSKAADPLSVSDIGDEIGVDQPRASRLVQQGVARGFVRREADPDDARRTRIALTEQGMSMAQGLRSSRRESLGTALTSFTPDERAELARLLTKLADHWPQA